MRAFVWVSLLLCALGSLGSPLRAVASCDVGGADAAALKDAYVAIDSGCDCSAAGPGIYRACAAGIIRARIEGMQLPRSCGHQARRYAAKSVCGRPGAVVCCRVRADGRERDRILDDAAQCVDESGYTACVSSYQSIVTGCDAGGCVPVPFCGDYYVDPGEDCDPPNPDLGCDATCHTIPCQIVPDTCGNGVLDAGEDCDSPGLATCSNDCRLASCQSPALGEIDLACVAAGTTVEAGAGTSGYLAAWRGPQHRSADILALRLDASGVPVDTAVTVVSEEQACYNVPSAPSVASDGSGYYVVWSDYGSSPTYPGAVEVAIRGRRVGAVSGAQSTDTFVSFVPIGSCRGSVSGPTTAASAGPSLFAVGWDSRYFCVGGSVFEDPDASLIDFSDAPATTAVPLGYPLQGPPLQLSTGASSAASLAGDTFWVWNALYGATLDPPYDYYLAASWTSGISTTAPFALTTRHAQSGDTRPDVAAGSSSLLVAWSQGVDDAATTATEIRAVRVTKASGRIDADGGLLLATVPAGVSAGPAVAFDGLRWLVVWAEAAGSTSDLRAVAVEQDGTIVDMTPRLVASDVVAQAPGVASIGDGHVLITFARQDGTSSAIRAVLVTP